MKQAGLFLTLLLFGFQCLAPKKQSSPASDIPQSPVAAASPDYLESDGSLDSILSYLKGKGAPVFDTSFHLLNPNGLWQEFENGLYEPRRARLIEKYWAG